MFIECEKYTFIKKKNEYNSTFGAHKNARNHLWNTFYEINFQVTTTAARQSRGEEFRLASTKCSDWRAAVT